MALPMTYRRRKMLREKGDAPDVYQYDTMSDGLRRQIIMKMDDLTRLSYYNLSRHGGLYKLILPQLRQEKQVFSLASRGFEDYDADIIEFRNWFLSEPDTDYLLTGLELFLFVVSRARCVDEERRSDEIAQINALMLEDGFGFQFVDGNIIEIGTEFIHKEVVVPVLGLLTEAKYNTVNEEFRKAHSEYRHGDYEDSIHDCCNAFESMMKIIANEQGWSEITEKSTVSSLVNAIFIHKFIPAYMAQEFTGLRTILESGINTIRNKAGGHGQGSNPRNIEKHVAEFQLNQTAAVLKLLAEYNR